MSSRLAPATLLVLAAIAVLATPAVATFLTDLWWFQSQDYERAFWLVSGLRWALGLGGGFLAFLAVAGTIRTAQRNTPAAPGRVAAGSEDDPVSVLMNNAPPGLLPFLLSGVVALMVGGATSTWTDHVVSAWYGGEFGYTDPVFGMDAKFYIFVLPLLLEVRATLMAVVVIAILAASATYLSRGAARVKLQEVEGQFVANGMAVHPEARRHLGSLVATWLLLMALGVALSRFELIYAKGPLIAGPGYAEIHATLPLLTLQAVMTAVAAVVTWRAFEKQSAGWGSLAGLLLVLPWGLVAVWPSMIQRFSVDPNELSREAPHIRDHIEATRFAFDLDRIGERALSGVNDLDLSILEKNRATLNNIRLWDHAPLLETFAQVQEIRTYYEFVDVDNDRYQIDGELRQIMLSPRELLATSLPAEASTWVNQRMTYTHGYGMALGPVNEVTDQGLPKLFIQDLPPKILKPELQIDRPEIYFGEKMDLEVFVNTTNAEFDHPRGDENVYTTYEGTGGVTLSALRRLWFALRFGSTELLFSNDISAESRVLMYRPVRDRIERIAPFLRVDDDPYLVIADGRLVWMVDAYTTTDRFPYSARIEDLNYLRNSVKATVDAYDGTVLFYRTHDPDPIADAWSAALPDLFRPIDEMPPALRSHVRVPSWSFNLQSRQYAKYHMNDHQVFYNLEDLWEIPQVDGDRMSPYYTVMTLPGEAEPEFIVMLPFNPTGKPNLAAWLVARSDGESYGELRAYKFPKEKMVYGPDTVVARINQKDTISEKISLWNQQGSQVHAGTLMVIPIEESLLYVQPLYLKSKNEGGAIPELRRVIVAYEDDIAMARTLEEALAEIFGAPEPPAAPSPEPSSEPGAEPAPAVDLDAVEQAKASWKRAQEAAATGDWEAWGKAMDALGQAVERLDD